MEESEIIENLLQVGRMLEHGELEYSGAEIDIKHYLQQYLSLHQPTDISSVCPECGCNKIQNDAGNYRSCLNILCHWEGQYGT